jgi:hypothetical protein
MNRSILRGVIGAKGASVKKRSLAAKRGVTEEKKSLAPKRRVTEEEVIGRRSGGIEEMA